MSLLSPVLHDVDGDRRAREAEAVAEIVAELAAGDEVVDVLGSLRDDEMALFDVALCRWYRGDAQAFEAVRPIFTAHLTKRAEGLLATREAAARADAEDAQAWSRAA